MLFEQPIAVIDSIADAGGELVVVGASTVVDPYSCWNLLEGWAPVQITGMDHALAVASNEQAVRGFIPNATCLVWDLKSVSAGRGLLDRTRDTTELAGVRVIKSTAFSVPAPDGFEVRQFATLVESDRHGTIETFTRVEIGPAKDADTPRRLIQRSSSCPAGVEHPSISDLPSSAFVYSHS